jgi:AraC-like DNA-binding protein
METFWDVKPSLRRLLADSLAQAAAALGQGNKAFLAPSFPGMTAPEDCRLIEAPLLVSPQSEGGEAESVTNWSEQGLLATRWPILIFVLDGECDMRFGVTPEMCKTLAVLPPNTGQYVVTARRNQFLFIPSHFPLPDGGGIHWERPDTQNAASTLMWLLPFATGCFVHFCRTQQQEHTLTKSIYLPVTRTFRLVEDVEREILSGQPQWRTITRNSLEILVALLQRHVASAQFELGFSRTLPRAERGTTPPNRPSHLALQLACTFIEDHLQESLLVSQVAGVAGISASSLNQLFRRHFQSSIAQYIISRRIERASTLLAETNLAVSQVALQSGFPRLEHFSRTFRRAAGLSPLAYRRRYQKNG